MTDFSNFLKKYSLPVGNLMDEITDPLNISESFDYVISHLECKAQKEHLRPKKDEYCKEIHRQLKSGEFRITKRDFRQMEVKDGPKARIVQCPKVFHRVGCHAIMVPFEKYAHQSLINNTAASIKGRGMHWLHDILENDLLTHPETRYYYQCDIRHFYDTISQEKMKQQVRLYTSDTRLLPMLDNFVELLPNGISKGLRSSQSFANLHLSEVDHSFCRHSDKSEPNTLIIDGEEVTFFYYRYCDDIVFVSDSKRGLWKLRTRLVSLLTDLDLEIKPSEAVRPLETGLDFLGYVTYVDDSGEERKVYSRIRKRTKKKFARRLNGVKSRKRRQTLIGSFFGMATHGDCRHLLKTLITPTEFRKLKHKRKMKDFGSFNISPVTLDGKKNFRGKKISARELDRRGIIVVDFEKLIPKRETEEYNRRCQDASAKNVDLSLVEKPKEKYLVQLICNDSLYKMWTGDKEIWHILDQIEAQQGRPFFTGVTIDYSAQYPKLNLVNPSVLNLTPPTDDKVRELFTRFNLKLNPYE